MKLKISFRHLEDFDIGFESVKRGDLPDYGSYTWILYLGFIDIVRHS
jgi:hypothetical protein